MPANDVPAFGPVGLEWAKRYRELEEAREIFLAERKRTLTRLIPEVEAALAKIGLPFRAAVAGKAAGKAQPSKDTGEWTWYVDGAYATALPARQAPATRDDVSGVDVFLDVDDDGEFVFFTQIWFLDKEHRLFKPSDAGAQNLVRPDHPTSRAFAELGADLASRTWIVDPYLGTAPAWIAPNDAAAFRYEKFAEACRALPAQFVEADGKIARLYQAACLA